MDAIILFACMLCISRFAAVYDAHLLLPGYINVSQRTSRVLVSGIPHPVSRSKNPPENRQRLAVVGLIMYVLTAACILLCVYIGLTLEPVETLEYVGLHVRSGAVSIENSTEHLIGGIARIVFLFEAALYLINDCRFFVSRAQTDIQKAFVCILVLVLLVVIVILFVVHVRVISDWWAKIRGALG